MGVLNKMTKASSCRKCRTNLLGVSYLMIAAKLDGGGKICLVCFNRLFAESKCESVAEFVRSYIQMNKTDSVQSLKREIRELRELLDAVTNPNGGHK